VAPAVLADGTGVVLKVQWPHRESEYEAAALARWDGAGAVRLVGRDTELHALLIERCLPGVALSTVDGRTALDVLIGLLPRLWRVTTGPFTRLTDEAVHWADGLRGTWERAGRPVEVRLVDAAIGYLRELAADQDGQEQVLLHQDLHGDNVLRAEREPWLTIDPKPLVGERAFGIAPIVRSAELGHGPELVRYRFDKLTAELGLDRERARGWAVGQAVAWGLDEDGVFASHIEAATWLLNRA
jgi:streptomycin 6-kinase